jgi:hypothetical protein
LGALNQRHEIGECFFAVCVKLQRITARDAL